MTTTAAKKAQHREWAAALDAAQSDAYLAGLAHKPTPMVVYSPKVPFFDESPDLSQPVYHVPAGPCGFAWVKLSAESGPEGAEARKFINWLLGRTKSEYPPTEHPAFRLPDKRSYDWGYDWWVSGFDQSVECKSAAAGAFAKAIREAVPGLIAWPMSRLD